MFNTYQELVDRIDELLKEREKQQKKHQRMIDIFTSIPRTTIDRMYEKGDITQEERIYWEILKQRRRMNVSNNDKN